jgi:two-component system response regulator YesN
MSYQLLLVDDEIHAIEGVRSDLDLDSLNISRLYTAFNLNQAKEIIQREKIDIMLCDIEMPQGSGLELLSWVREYDPNIVSIFITSHADFRYAKEAIQLGILDYLLKPVLASELERVIRKAQEAIDQNSEISQIKQSHLLWMKHKSVVIERFWLDLITHTIPSNWPAILKEAEHHQLPILEETVFLPILISVKRWNRTLSRRDERIMEYALKKTAEELILGEQRNGILFYLDHGEILCIYEYDKQLEESFDAQIIQSCNHYIQTGNQYFYCDLSCYIGKPVETPQVADMVANLRRQDHNNVAFYNQTFQFGDNFDTSSVVEMPDMSIWITLLKSGTKDEVMMQVKDFLMNLVRDQRINAPILYRFHQDFMQALFSYLNVIGIQAHQLYGDDDSKRLSELAVQSVDGLISWVDHALDKAIFQTQAIEESETVVQQVKRYIDHHLDQELSRDAIANDVYLNPDYLSRIFKRETGHSISDYVLLARMNKAKELLRQTNIPISAIATSVGHTNFSHFARIFKKHVGIGPTEYRNQFKENMG